MTETAYHEKLAAFLGNLACGDAGPALAQGIVQRAVDRENRLLAQLVAQRLTPDEPEACPAAGALPDDLRSELKQIAPGPPPFQLPWNGSRPGQITRYLHVGCRPLRRRALSRRLRAVGSNDGGGPSMRNAIIA
jgi:hypothetical protein